MTNHTFQNILDHFIGLDQLLNTHVVSKQTYPPYNIVKKGDNYTIEIALAGYTPDELNVTYADNRLYIEGNTLLESPDVSSTEENPFVTEYIYKGIATRKFKLTFPLSPQIVIDSTKLENGLLKILLHREVPESQQPKRIPILL